MERVFAQSELEAIAQALADTSEGLTGSDIAHLLATLKMSDPMPGTTKWKRLYNAFAERQNHSQNRRAILEFIRQAMKPERYARDAARFEPMRTNLNRALAFSGLAVDAAGKLSEVAQVKTLTEATRRAQELRADLTSRGVHPDVLRFCRAELVADNYFHAVLEATKSIADKLRAKSGLTEDGAPLVDLTLCGDSPKLRVNPLVTESQKSEQKGFANLVKGTFGMFRNTTAHEARIWKRVLICATLRSSRICRKDKSFSCDAFQVDVIGTPRFRAIASTREPLILDQPSDARLLLAWNSFDLDGPRWLRLKQNIGRCDSGRVPPKGHLADGDGGHPRR